MFHVTVFCHDRNEVINSRRYKTWKGAHAFFIQMAGAAGVNTSVSITDFTIA